jgi:hypothetical protein
VSAWSVCPSRDRLNAQNHALRCALVRGCSCKEASANGLATRVDGSSSALPIVSLAAPLLPPPRPQWTHCTRRLPYFHAVKSLLTSSTPFSSSPMLCSGCDSYICFHRGARWARRHGRFCGVFPAHGDSRSHTDRHSRAAVHEINAKNSIRPLPLLGSQSRQRQACSTRRMETSCTSRKRTTHPSGNYRCPGVPRCPHLRVDGFTHVYRLESGCLAGTSLHTATPTASEQRRAGSFCGFASIQHWFRLLWADIFVASVA